MWKNRLLEETLVNHDLNRTDPAVSRARPAGVCLILMVMLIFTGPGCSGRSDKTGVSRPIVTGVTIATVTPVRTDEFFEATGTVRSGRTSIIASRVMGTVTSLHVKEGDRVAPGALLMTIDDSDARQRARAAAMAVDAARENRSLAEATWSRYQGLFDRQAISLQEMDQVATRRKIAEAEYERAVAMAEEARTYLSFTRITAPCDGVVIAKYIDEGSTASPGMPLFTVEGIGDAYVEVHADEGLAGRISAGMPADLVVDSLEKTLKGTVREVLPDIDPRTRTFTVKIDVPQEDLRTGLFVRARIPVRTKEILAIPAGAIVRRGQLTGVYLLDPDGILTYRLIKEGQPTAAGIEVLSGLSAGDRIITGGTEKARDGGVLAERAE